MKSLTTIFLCLTAIALILFCFTEDTHTCKWQSCPYKGITKDQWKGYNTRKISDRDRFVNSMMQANGHRLTYKNLIKKEESI